ISVMLSPTVCASPAMIVSPLLPALQPQHLRQEPDLLIDLLRAQRIGEERSFGAPGGRREELEPPLTPAGQRGDDVVDRGRIRSAPDPEALWPAGDPIDRGLQSPGLV